MRIRETSVPLLSALALAIACNLMGSVPAVESPVSTAVPAAALPSETSDQGLARLTEVENLVETRASATDAWTAASQDQALFADWQVRTGPDGLARLDFSDGTFLRLSPNTTMTIRNTTGEGESAFVQLKLALGKLWIVLTGGQLEVETPIGVASVRGSVESVALHGDPDDPASLILTVNCLEGHCGLHNDQGGQDFTGGKGSTVTGISPPTGPTPLGSEDFADFQQHLPESVTATPTARLQPTSTPRPSATPPPAATSTPGGGGTGPVVPPLQLASKEIKCISGCDFNGSTFTLQITIVPAGGVPPYTFHPAQSYTRTFAICDDARGVVTVEDAAGQGMLVAWEYQVSGCD